MKITKLKKGTILILVFQLMATFLVILTKIISKDFDNSLIVVVRLGLASLVFTGALLFFKRMRRDIKKLTFKQLLQIIFLGIWSSGIGFILNVTAIRFAGAGIGSVLGKLESVFGILIAMIILKEKMKARHLLFLGGIVIGLFMIAKIDGQNYHQSTFLIGVLCGLIAAVVFGFGNVLSKILLNSTIPAWLVIYIRSIAGCIFAIVFSLLTITSISKSFAALHIFDWIKLTYIGVVHSVLGFLMMYYALQKMSVKQFSILIMISPILSLTIGSLFLHEQLSFIQWTGIGILLSTVVLFMKYK